MKNLIGLPLFVLLLSFGQIAAAQTVKKGANKVEMGAKKVGHNTAGVASKGKSRVAHTTVKGKTGPNHQTIYLDQNSRYYWIDKKGRRHYVPKSALKNKR